MRAGMVQVAAWVAGGIVLGSCESEPLGPAERHPSSAFRAESNIKAPSNLVATASSASRTELTWRDNSTNENGFEVMRSTDVSPLAVHGTTSAGVVSFADAGVEPSNTYCYAVRAFKVSGRSKSYSALSATGCATTPVAAGAPSAPSGTNARSTSSTSVAIGWTDNAGDETGFQIQRAPNPSGPWSAAGTVGPNQSSASDAGRASETQVCYRVAAVNAIGRSNWSETACAIPPAGPTNLRVTGSTPSRVDLTWSDNSTVEDGYQIQRADTYDGPYSVIADLPSDATVFHEADLVSDETYWYQVRAKRAGGFSDLAGPTSGVTATTVPAAPTWISASPLNGTWTDIIWRDNSTNEAGIRVDRSQAGGPWVTIRSGGPQVEGPSFLRDGEPYPVETEICYRITAFNAVGESSTTGCTALPALPVDLTAKVRDGVVELTWTDVSQFEDGFYIVRADGMSESFYYVYDGVGPNVTTYRDPSPDPQWASYYLRGMKGPEGYSCCSNAVDVYLPSAGSP